MKPVSLYNYTWYFGWTGLPSSMNTFTFTLQLVEGGVVKETIYINGGGGTGSSGYRTGTYTTSVQSSGSWEIVKVNLNNVDYSPAEFFNTLGGRFAYYTATPFTSGYQTNNVGNYYHGLSFWLGY